MRFENEEIHTKKGPVFPKRPNVRRTVRGDCVETRLDRFPSDVSVLSEVELVFGHLQTFSGGEFLVLVKMP